MQVVKYLAVPTMPDLSRSLAYLADAEHPNHKAHETRPLRLVGAKTPSGFIGRLRSAIAAINLGAAPKNQLRNAATWWVCSFAPGTFLRDYEMTEYAEVLQRALGLRDLYAFCWHVGVGGSADLNIIDPGIDLDPIPCLRRSRAINLLARARHRSDRILRQLNAERQADGESVIPTILDDQAASRRRRGVVSLEKVLLAQTPATSPINREALPEIMGAAGFRRADWELDLRGWLVVHRLPRKSTSGASTEPKPPLRLQINDLLFLLNMARLLAKQKPKDRPGKAPENTEPGRSGNTLRRTTTDVIQPTSTSDQANDHDHLSI